MCFMKLVLCEKRYFYIHYLFKCEIESNQTSYCSLNILNLGSFENLKDAIYRCRIMHVIFKGSET